MKLLRETIRQLILEGAKTLAKQYGVPLIESNTMFK
jgi:hypothetical protein